MHRVALALLVGSYTAGCGGSGTVDAELALDGPARIRVDHLGAVQGPQVVLSDGTEPQGVVWTVSDGGVARIDGDSIVAEAPGEAQVTGSWEGQAVSWTLVVDPAMILHIQNARPRVSVGDMGTLRASATIGQESVDPGEVTWSSSDAELLTVAADGTYEALGTGRVWVTAKTANGAESMVEIDVQ